MTDTDITGTFLCWISHQSENDRTKDMAWTNRTLHEAAVEETCLQLGSRRVRIGQTWKVRARDLITNRLFTVVVIANGQNDFEVVSVKPYSPRNRVI